MKNTLLYKTFIITVLLWVSATSAGGQTVDSLLNALDTKDLSATDRMKIIDNLDRIFIQAQPEKLLEYAGKGLQIAENVNDRSYIALFNEHLGRYYSQKHSFDTAATYCRRALKTALLARDRKRECRALITLASIEKNCNRTETALEYFRQALKIAETCNDAEAVVIACTYISDIYRTFYNEDKVLEYALRAYAVAEKEGLYERAVSPLIHIADLYRSRRDYSRALEYAQKACAAARQTNSAANAMAINQTLALLYGETGNADSALFHANECLKIAEQVRLPQYLLFAWNSMSNAYRAKKMYAESADAALHAREADSTNLYFLTNIFCNLLHASIVAGDMRQAERYFLLYDSVFQWYMDKQLHESLAEQEIRYESEKKQLRIAALERQKTLFVCIGVAGLLLAASVWIIFVQKIRNEKREKQLVASNAILEWEKKERKRFAADLHDGISGMLSSVKLEINEVATLQNVRKQLDDCIDTIRRIAQGTQPASLERYGLKAALEDYCLSFSNVAFRSFGSERRFDERLEQTAYYCACELVNNAVTHANAANISVQLLFGSDRLTLTVHDDGCGFATSADNCPTGSGIDSIRKRVAAFDGTVDIATSPENGTEINIELKTDSLT
jgi:signal transduction histidine kinase